MKLSDGRDLVPNYADGELSPDLRAGMERLIAASPELRGEVSRWRAFRRGVWAALRSERVPSGLADRVRSRLLVERRRARVFRLVPAFAAVGVAAALALAFIYRPKPSIPGVLPATRFAAAHELCGKGAHNGLNITADFAHARAELDRLRPYAVAVPDLSANGYFVHGACECIGHGELNVTQVGYGTHAERQEFLSLFSLDRRYMLDQSSAGASGGSVERAYEFASVDGVGVLKWFEAGGTFVIVGELPRPALERLAGDFAVTRVDRTASALASITVGN